jgi:cation:H+ antiporter
MLNFLIFAAALIALWIGAEILTKAAIKIARSLSLSEGFVGLTILAIGTDFPEIIVAVTGAIQKLQGQETSEIIIGNVIGSCMSQIALVLGVAGLLRVIRLKRKNILFDCLMLVGSSMIVYLTASDGLISRQDGLLFILFYLIYLIFLNRRNLNDQLEKEKKSKSKAKSKKNPSKRKKIKPKYFIQLIIGLAIIAKSSELVLDKGVHLASELGISEMMVGIILIGLGTSLPELVVSINAALKGAMAMSVSNLIGSNIVDLLLALGGSAIIAGWEVNRNIVQFDIPYLIFTTVIVVLFLLTKGKLERNESLLMMALYSIYIALKVMGF